jgi:hypothetical protein
MASRCVSVRNEHLPRVRSYETAKLITVWLGTWSADRNLVIEAFAVSGLEMLLN